MRDPGKISNRRNRVRGTRKRARTRGQTLAIFAIAFLGLAVTLGLAIDIGAIYVQFDHLKRAVDAAALSAAAQYRKGISSAEMELAAKEFLSLNNIDPDRLTVHVWNCEQVYAAVPDIDQDFIDFCPPQESTNHRKLVWVQATVDTDMYFLRLIGIDTIPLTTNAIGEGAPIDLMMIIDTSSSMTYDAACGDGINDDPDDDLVADDGLTMILTTTSSPTMAAVSLTCLAPRLVARSHTWGTGWMMTTTVSSMTAAPVVPTPSYFHRSPALIATITIAIRPSAMQPLPLPDFRPERRPPASRLKTYAMRQRNSSGSCLIRLTMSAWLPLRNLRL